MKVNPIRLSPIVLVVLIGACFAPVLRAHFFAVDDGPNIILNPNLTSGWAGIRAIWTAPYEGMYIPVTYSVWAVVGKFALGADGLLSPYPFHWVNWSVHLLNSWLVFLLLRRVWGLSAGEGLESDRVIWPAFAGALFWGLHPLQVEAVGWATGFKDLGSAFFSLLAFLAFLKGVEAAESPLSKRSEPSVWIGLATLGFLASLLAKPSSVTLPLVILLWLAIGPRKATPGPPRPLVIELFPLIWLLPSMVLIVVSSRAQSQSEPVLVTFWQRPVIAADALVFYAQKTLWPVNLVMHYGRTPARVLADGHAGLALAFILILVAGSVSALRRGWRLPAWAFGTSVIFLMPVLGIVPFAYQNLSTVADRYAYLALLGPALVITWALGNTWRRPATSRLIWGLTCAWLVVSGALTLRQTAYWHSTRAMALHILEVNPRSWIAECLLGDIASHQGDFTGALFDYRQAMADDPNYARAFTDAGVALAHLNRLDEARAAFLRAANFQYAPMDTRVADDVNLGMIAEIEGDPDAARGFYAAALVFDPQDAHVRDRLSRLNR